MKQESRGLVMFLLSLVGSVALIILQDPSLRRSVVEWWGRQSLSQRIITHSEKETVYGIAKEAEEILRREGKNASS